MSFSEKVIKRFWSKVIIGYSDECWEWQAGISSAGYGAFSDKGITHGAHRVSYELHSRNKIPLGMCVCHSCDNKLCVNPDHLWLGTRADNVYDKTQKNRQARGESNGITKLNDKLIRKIRKLHKTEKRSSRYLAKVFGVSKATIQRIINYQTWKHVR